MKLYTCGVKDLPNKLEQYRLDRGLTKTEMAGLFGVDFQVYYSWIKRNSIPKGQLETAKTILGMKGDASAVRAELLDVATQLPDEKAELLLQMARGLLKPSEGV